MRDAMIHKPFYRLDQPRLGAAVLLILSLLLGLVTDEAKAAPRKTQLSLTPVINSLQVVNGHLVASGTVTTTIK
ncbi:MAG TPA: hypothetical protein VL793_14220, partial [Patescibacteria group bacterium]|nr:hypothetical protein [Patescibacteria group bacterium]